MNNDFLETSTQASGARGLGSTVAIVSVIRKFSERSPLHIPVTLVPAGTVSRPRWSCMKFTQPRLAANVLPSPLTTPDKGQRAGVGKVEFYRRVLREGSKAVTMEFICNVTPWLQRHCCSVTRGHDVTARLPSSSSYLLLRVSRTSR